MTIGQRDFFGGRAGEYELPGGVQIDTCRSCGATIVWKKTANDRWIPLSVATIEERDGVTYALTHVADCAHANAWRRM